MTTYHEPPPPTDDDAPGQDDDHEWHPTGPEWEAVTASYRAAEKAFDAVAHLAGPTLDEPDYPFIDWEDFWRQDPPDAEWLYQDILARGRGHSLYAGHKTGKSLLMLYIAQHIARTGLALVVYLDYEMGNDDLRERLEQMGLNADSDLSWLHYWVIPSLPPLDTPAGGKQLVERIDQARARHPDEDRHVCVIIDTTARAVAGEENNADTIRGFYRHTGALLKRQRITWARLDHAGKNKEAVGARGSSAKGDDVDVVWKVAKTTDGLRLDNEASRMAWVPKVVLLRKEDAPVLRYVQVHDSYPPGTKELAEAIDALAPPDDLSERKIGKLVRESGFSFSQNLLPHAMRWRAEIRGVTPRVTPSRQPLDVADPNDPF